MLGIDPEVWGALLFVAIVLGLTVPTALLLGLAIRASRPDVRPPAAVPAHESPARGPGRAPHPGEVLLCATNGHAVTDWCTTTDGRPVCTRCGHPVERRAPFDQTTVDLEKLWAAS